MQISFTNHRVKYLLRNKARIRALLNKIAINNKHTIRHIDYIFCDKKYILNINRINLNHNYPTDIITFPLSEDNQIEAEIYICLPVVRENARQYGVSTYHELLRVIIHGVLHLVGYDDHTVAERREMRRQEDLYLDLFFSPQ